MRVGIQRDVVLCALWGIHNVHFSMPRGWLSFLSRLEKAVERAFSYRAVF